MVQPQGLYPPFMQPPGAYLPGMYPPYTQPAPFFGPGPPPQWGTQSQLAAQGQVRVQKPSAGEVTGAGVRLGPDPEQPEKPQPSTPPTPKVSMSSVSIQAEMNEPLPGTDSQSLESLRRDFADKLRTMRGDLVQGLRAQRQDLRAAVQGVDALIAELRQRCAEAERDGLQEFELMKAHLSSLQNRKLVVLSREREDRAKLIEGIDEVARRVDIAASGGHSYEAMASFVRDYPALQHTAQTLWTRAAALSPVDMTLEDIPFEARARTDKLRKFAVIGRLQRAKDLCLWRSEQQRRGFEREAADANAWLQHLETLLDRYANEFAHVCYFCAERFSVNSANTRCIYNAGTSPRSGRPLAADPRVPSGLWGAGVHFWVPLGAAPGPGGGARAGYELPSTYGLAPYPGYGGFAEPGIDASRPSTPPRSPWWDIVDPARPPGAYYAGSQPLPIAAVEVQLRKIAQLCEQRGLDIRTAFRALDMNGDGFISPQEFRHALSQLRLGLADEEVGWLLARLDTNADGMVSYEEFLTQMFNAVRDLRTANVGQAFVDHFAGVDAAAHSLWQRVARAFRDRGVPLRQVFALFDADGDGIISRQELQEAFRLMRLGLSETDVERLLRDIDSNEDGRVNIHEFVNKLQQ